jgi:hypothetical protein
LMIDLESLSEIATAERTATALSEENRDAL